MAKNVKINIQFPKNSELKSQMEQVTKYLEKNAILDFKIDTKSFTKSLGEMSNALQSLKGKLGSFGVLDSFIDENTANKSKKAISDIAVEFQNLSDATNRVNSKTIIDASGTTEINKYKDSLAKTTSETIKNGEVTKQVFEENSQVISKLQNQLQDKLNTASNNGLVNPGVITDLQNRLNSINTDTPEKEINELKTSIANLASSDSSIVRLQNAISSMSNSIKNSKTKYGSLLNIKDIENAKNQIDNLKKTMQDLSNGKSISSTAISGAINKGNVALREMNANARNASSALKLTQRDAMSLGNAVQTTMGKFGIYASTAVAMRQLFNVIKDGIGYIKSLDEAFFNISSTMDISKSQFDDMSVKVQKMAKDMGTSAESVMKVVQTYANASTDLNEVLDKTAPSVILSNITGMQTGEVTKAVNSAVNAFKMLDEEGATATSSVERFSDVIVKTSQNMQYDFGEGITEIISAIKDSGNVAYEAGMSYESYVSKMGAMIEATGRSGDELANGMKMIIARTYSIKSLGEELGVTSEEFNKAGKALQDFDINISNGDGSLKSMDEVLDIVAGKWTTMTSAEQNYLAEALAGWTKILARIYRNIYYRTTLNRGTPNVKTRTILC